MHFTYQALPFRSGFWFHLRLLSCSLMNKDVKFSHFVQHIKIVLLGLFLLFIQPMVHHLSRFSSPQLKTTTLLLHIVQVLGKTPQLHLCL